MKSRLNEVIGDNIRASAPEKTETVEDVKTPFNESSAKENSESNSEESDALSYFEKLASDG